MTKKQLLTAEQKCYKCSSRLIYALEELSAMASVALGYEVIADICNGEEIEFRPLNEHGRPDNLECIRMETVLNVLKK